MNDYDLIRRCDVLEILDDEGSLGRTRKLVEQLVTVTPEAQAAEIERLRFDLKRAVEERDEALNQVDSAMRSLDVLLNLVAEPTGDKP